MNSCCSDAISLPRLEGRCRSYEAPRFRGGAYDSSCFWQQAILAEKDTQLHKLKEGVRALNICEAAQISTLVHAEILLSYAVRSCCPELPYLVLISQKLCIPQCSQASLHPRIPMLDSKNAVCPRSRR